MTREEDIAEAKMYADALIKFVNADHNDKIEFNRDIGCRIRDHIEYLRREVLNLQRGATTCEK